MLYEHSALTVFAVMYYRSVQPFTLKVILNGTSPLNRRVNADADDAKAEEEEHEYPFQYRSTGASTLNNSHTSALTVRTSNFLRSFPRPLLSYFLESHRFILYIG